LAFQPFAGFEVFFGIPKEVRIAGHFEEFPGDERGFFGRAFHRGCFGVRGRAGFHFFDDLEAFFAENVGAGAGAEQRKPNRSHGKHSEQQLDRGHRPQSYQN
jgi:hypothetical protein